MTINESHTNTSHKDTTMITALPFVIGNDNGINLVGPIDPATDYSNTILQAGVQTISYDGITYPAPMAFNGAKEKEIFVSRNDDMISIGRYLDLDPMYGEINKAISKGKSVNMEIVKARMSQLLDSAVTRQHKGERLSGVAIGLPALADGTVGLPEIGLSRVMIEEFIELTGFNIVNGQVVYIERHPLAETACSGLYIVRRVASNHKALFINPARIKRAGGDFDGDQLHLHPKGFRVETDLTWLKPISIDRVTCNWNKAIRHHDWIPATQLAEGLLVAKLLQGVVTNGIETLAVVAVNLANKSVRFKKKIGDITPAELTGLVKDGCAVYFEITQDFRKYAQGLSGRYEEALWNFIDLCLGKTSRLNILAAGKVDKDGRQVNFNLINEIMSEVTRTGAKSMREYLEARPVMHSTIGQPKAAVASGVANYIAEHGVESMLEVMAGERVEEAAPIKAVKRNRKPVSYVVEEAIELPRLHMGQKGWGYIADLLNVLDRENRYSVFVDNRGTVINVNGTRVQLGRIEFKMGRSHMAVKMNGEKRLASLVIDYTTKTQTPESLVLTTIQFLIAKAIIKATNDNLDSANSWIKSQVIVAIDEILDSHAVRLMPGEIPLQHLEAQIKPAENGVQASYLAHTKLMLLLENGKLANPITGEMMEFDPGLTSKSKPGKTIAYKTPGFAFPSMMNEACVWIDNTERKRREVRTLKTAKVPVTKHHWYTRQVSGAIADRCMDGVWVLFDGLGTAFDKAEDNGDLGFITKHGMEWFAVKEDQAKHGNLQEKDANRIARNMGFEVYQDLESIGWTVTYSYRKVGRVEGETAFERLITLTGPDTSDFKTQTWVKPWLCGHKFVAQTIEGEYFVKINNALVPVCGFIPVESMLGKKLDASICLAYDGLARGRREFDVNTPAFDQVIELPETHEVIKDGISIGEGIPGIYPTFILSEDEDIKTGVQSNGFPQSAQRARMLGLSVTIENRTGEELGILAKALQPVVEEICGVEGEVIDVEYVDVTPVEFQLEGA